MAKISFMLFCGLFFATVNSELEIFRRLTVPDCPGGSFDLHEGKISEAKQTTIPIEREAKGDKRTLLFESYQKMTKSRSYQSLLNKGKAKGLTKDETEAVYLYSMTTKVYLELNKGLREGNNKYPVWHYWLQSALTKLPKTQTKLYRGITKMAKIKVGTTLGLPGFSSTDDDEGESHKYSNPGCTVLAFDRSQQGALVGDLTQIPSTEVLIPPTEKFKVYKMECVGEYNYIYLKPSVTKKTSGCSTQTYPSVLMILVIIQRFF